MLPQNPASSDPIPVDPIAGSKMLQERFRSVSLQPDQVVIHGGRRATFIRMTHDGEAIIRHWGESRAMAVPPGTLSHAPVKQRWPERPPAQ